MDGGGSSSNPSSLYLMLDGNKGYNQCEGAEFEIGFQLAIWKLEHNSKYWS